MKGPGMWKHARVYKSVRREWRRCTMSAGLILNPVMGVQ